MASFAIDPEKGIIEDTKEDAKEKKKEPAKKEEPNSDKKNAKPPSGPPPAKKGDVACASLRGLSCMLASLLFGLLALFIILFALMIYLAVVSGQQERSGAQNPELCITKPCLNDAAYILENMNLSADPCQDFFTYVCGNFENVHADLSFTDDQTELIEDMNEARLASIMEEPLPAPNIGDPSAEWQMKKFFQVCTDEFSKTDSGALALISMMKSLGGWDGAGTWDTTFDMNTMLQGAHKTFGATPFFRLDVDQDDDSDVVGHRDQVYMIQVRKPSLSLDSWMGREAYKDQFQVYVSSVLTLVRSETGHPVTPDKKYELDQAVTDIVNMEVEVVNVLGNMTVIRQSEYKTINEIQSYFNGTVNWVDMLNAYFDGAVIGTDVIHVHDFGYIVAVAKYLKDNPAANLETKRKYNNYIGWKIFQEFVYDLGWKYMQAVHVWDYYQFQSEFSFETTYKRCIGQVKRYFTDALSLLFIQRAFGDQSNAETKAITYYMKNALIDRISGYNWMTSDTKTNCSYKVSNTIDQVGYPDWISDSAIVDKIYQDAKVALMSDSHFDNMIQMIRFIRLQEIGKVLEHTVPPESWATDAIYDVGAVYDKENNQIYIPAGILQFPVFDLGIPASVNFGALGRYLGRRLISVIDPAGNDRDATGAHVNIWDSQTNATFYQNSIPCYMKLFNDTGEVADHYAELNYEDVGGLHIGYNAYKKAYPSKSDMVIPGLQHMTSDQLFFISYGQTFCKSGPYILIDDHIVLDRVLMQSPEFASSFNCKSGSPYVGNNICPGF